MKIWVEGNQDAHIIVYLQERLQSRSVATVEPKRPNCRALIIMRDDETPPGSCLIIVVPTPTLNKCCSCSCSCCSSMGFHRRCLLPFRTISSLSVLSGAQSCISLMLAPFQLENTADLSESSHAAARAGWRDDGEPPPLRDTPVALPGEDCPDRRPPAAHHL